METLAKVNDEEDQTSSLQSPSPVLKLLQTTSEEVFRSHPRR